MSDPMLDRLGFFYLGRQVDAEKFAEGAPVHYDSRRLTTHAVIVGMTGSGKTGLGISLLEEAALDGVPAIVLDPKGDLSNLALAFPDLAPSDFEPWIDPDDAARKGLGTAGLAAAEAKKWREGLAGWGIEPSRIAAFRKAADVAVFTPGSSAGLPLALVRPLSPPEGFAAADAEEREERLAGTVAALLALASVPATERSPETALLSILVSSAWDEGRTVALPDLVRLVLTPPISEVGALPLDEFLPPAARKELANALNAVVASPSLRRWTAGAPLDVSALLRTPEGKPRLSVISIAHLPDTERMFVVTLLATELVAWMRRQSGTTSLRAVFYMDELFGYLPPTAQPPSKRPLLTLLKQARAFGLGCVFATQNPVDLDYKALTNAGTWFVGRLAAERDKARLLDGLESAAAGSGRALDRAAVDRAISALPARVFVLSDAAEAGPVLMKSRWAMSYLRGPLTKDQLSDLTKDRKVAAAAPPEPDRRPGTAASGMGERPALAPEIPQVFIPPASASGVVGWRAVLVGAAAIPFRDAKRGIDTVQELVEAIPFDEGPVGFDPGRATVLEVLVSQLRDEPPLEGLFSAVPEAGRSAKRLAALRKGWLDSILQRRRIELMASSSAKLVSRPGESEEEFRGRLAHAVREKRDAEVDRLQQQYAARIRTLEDGVRRAEMRAEKEKSDVTSAGASAAFQIGAAVLGAILGRKAISAGNLGRTATAARGVGRTARQRTEAKQAEESVELAKERLAELVLELEERSEATASKFALGSEPLERIAIAPRKSEIEVRLFAVGWLPVSELGTASEKPIAV